MSLPTFQQIALDQGGRGPAPKTLEGSLQSFSLFEILQFLRLGALTGVLTITHEDEEVHLTVGDGKIVNSSVFSHRQRLGELLIMRGIITRRELDDILSAKRDGAIAKPLGQVLVERQMIDEETLRQTLRLQLEEEIWSLLNWVDGEFRFDPCETLGETAPVVIELEIEPLILEGTRRQDEWQTITALIPSGDLIPVPVAPESFHEPDASLTANEWRMLALINGALTVESLVDRSGLGRFETYRILATFVQQGWLACESDAEAGERTSHAAQRRSSGVSGPEEPSGAGEADESNGSGTPWRRRRRPQREGGLTIARAHRTLIGLACATANELLVAAQRRHVHDPSGRWPLTPLMWQRITGHYPAADGVGVRSGLLDAALFEVLWVPLTDEEAKAQLAEDTWTALTDLIGDLAAALSASMNARDWAKMESQMAADLGEATVEHQGPIALSASDLTRCIGQANSTEVSDNGR